MNNVWSDIALLLGVVVVLLAVLAAGGVPLAGDVLGWVGRGVLVLFGSRGHNRL